MPFIDQWCDVTAAVPSPKMIIVLCNCLQGWWWSPPSAPPEPPLPPSLPPSLPHPPLLLFFLTISVPPTRVLSQHSLRRLLWRFYFSATCISHDQTRVKENAAWWKHMESFSLMLLPHHQHHHHHHLVCACLVTLGVEEASLWLILLC